MKKCELCERTPRMYCESDQASLCWDCDEKVHRANFLVAKHCRTLLCHVCQSLTPWKASGAKLCPTVSVCDSCLANASSTHCRPRHGGVLRPENQSERSDGDDADAAAAGDVNDDEDSDDYGDDSEDDDDDDEEEEENDVDEEDENQVVPWSGESHSPPPPVSCSSSSSSGSEDEASLKRRRDFTDLYSDDEIGCSSSHIGSRATANDEANTCSTMSSCRPLKQPRITTAAAAVAASEPDDDNQAESRSTAIINSLRRLQKQMITNDGGGGDDDASATVLAICRLSKDENR